MILLDTNIVSDGLKPKPNEKVEAWLDANESAPLWISAITVAELRAGVETKSDGKKKARLHQAVDRAIDHFGGLCVSFDALAAGHYARVVAARRKIGRPIGVMDAQIAAIAISAGCQLATLNGKDFEGIEGLQVIDPLV